MTTIAGLLDEIAAAREQLRTAIEGAAGSWEDATLAPEGDDGSDAWTPKQAARHVIGATSYFASFLATGLGVAFSPERPQIEIPSDALAALDSSFDAATALVASVADEALALPAPVAEGSIGYATALGHHVEQTVEGALQMMAIHAADHAKQIVEGTATG